MTDSDVVEPPKKRRGKVRVKPDPKAEPIVDDNGQKLVRVERSVVEDDPEVDEATERELWDPVDEPEAAAESLRQEESQEQADEEEPPPLELPPIRTIEDVAERGRLRREYRAKYGASLPTETKTDGPELPDAYDARLHPRTLADLALFLDTDRNYFIHVVRKGPRLSQGMPVTGVQRPIRDYITDGEFAAIYGGGDYELTLRGPPRRGAVVDPATGRTRDVALSDPIKYTVPHAIPPNLDAVLPEDEDEEDMPLPPNTLPRRVNSPADARIHEANLAHEERLLDRRERREKDLENKIATMPEQMAPLIHTLDRANERTVELVREQARREEMLRRDAERRAEEARAQARPTDITEVGSMITGLVQALGPRTNPEEVSRVSDMAQREREQLVHAHRDELKRVQEAADRRASDAEERADRRIKDIEERSSIRVREAEERAEKVVRETRADVDKQIRDIERTLSARLDDEKRNSERELRSQQAAWESKLETQKTAFELRIATKDDEISRLRAENSRLLADLEKAKDLPDQINKFTATAESLGYKKPGEKDDDEDDEKEEPPQDWKTMLGQIGLNLVQGLPHMIAEARGAVRDARAAAPTADQAYQQMYTQAGATVPAAMAARPLVGRSGQPFVPRRLAFATDDGPAFPTAHEAPPPPPIMPNGSPAQPVPQMQPQPAQPAAQPAPQMQPQPQPVVQPVMHQPPPMQPPPVMHQPPQPAPAQHPPMQFGINELQNVRHTLEQAFEQGAEPTEVAQSFVQQLGPDQVRAVLAQATPELITTSILTLPDGPTSPLVRREGQKYIRELWAALHKIVG